MIVPKMQQARNGGRGSTEDSRGPTCSRASSLRWRRRAHAAGPARRGDRLVLSQRVIVCALAICAAFLFVALAAAAIFNVAAKADRRVSSAGWESIGSTVLDEGALSTTPICLSPTGPAMEHVRGPKASSVAPASLALICASNLLAGMLAATVSTTTVVVEVAMVVGAGLVDAGRSDCVPG